MHNCKYCGRELKSKAGQLRHEASCKDKELDHDTRDIWSNGEQSEDEIATIVDIAEEISNDVDEMVDNAEIRVGTIDELYPVGVVESKDSVVQLEVMGGEETYYDGHPRRATKLRGLLSRTFDKRERHKIRQLIMKVENETYKG